jgi:Flp pilus assembly protein TadD
MAVSVACTIGRLAAAAAVAAALAGCSASRDVTGSIQTTRAARETVTPEAREARWRELATSYAAAYAKNPGDAPTAYGYGVALRAVGQRAQALAVLEAASLKHPRQGKILAAYGRALADVGRHEDALAVLERAHSPDAPDWKILNAQGAILDQMDRAAEARRYYEAALKIAPGEPAILSNLGLSYALAKDLAQAEATLLQAAASPKADEKVLANLALVQSLKAGKPAKAPPKPAA